MIGGNLVFEIFEIIAPIFVVAALGFLFEKRGPSFDSTTLSRLALWIGTPCLVFSSLTNTALPDEALARMIGITFAVAVLGGALACLVLVLFRLPQRTFLSPLALPNAGNAGLPVVFFTFSDAGLAIGAAFFFVIALVQYTVVPMVVSGELGLRKLLKEPLIWTVLAVIGFRVVDVTPPKIIADTTALLGGMMIPVMLILLGGALARLRVKDIATSILLAMLRLTIGLATGLSMVYLFGLDGIEAGAVFLMSAMPSALVTYVISQHYGREPERVAAFVVSSTVLNFLCLPVLIAAALHIAAL